MTRITAAICCLALAVLGQQAQSADTIADNLSNTRNGGQSVNNASWAAQAFTTTLTGYVLDSIVLEMSRDAGAVGTVELIIFDSDGTDGRPGAAVTGVIGTIDVASDLTADPANVPFTGLSVNLTPGITYYLVLRGSGMSGGDALWSYTGNTSGTGFPSNYSESNDTGANWDAPTLSSPQKMAITAVPEPSTWLLAGLSTLAIGMAARRRAG